MTKVRAKFKVIQISEHSGGNKVIKLNPVYSSDPLHENKAFSDYTPAGSIELVISTGKPAGDDFKVDKEYYVDFIEAE